MLIPVYGFVEGDTLGILVLARSSMTVAELSAKLAGSARLRVAMTPPYALYYRGEALPEDRTVASVGIATLSRIDLRRGPVARGSANGD
jgi:hypothetical protein